MPTDATTASYDRMWTDLEPIGRDRASGGYRRHAWDDADLLLREWFAGEAAQRGMELVEDGNGNQFAWAGDASRRDAILLGSHLDSVPDGGPYDGPLGVVSSFAAVDAVAEARVEAGVEQERPVVVASFADEEGARFGIACAGSRLLTGSLEPDVVLARTDRDGRSLAEVLTARGRDPGQVGARPEILGRIDTFIELHVEQGRALVHQDAAVAVASAIWPHGRYRLEFSGEANHAGTTAMDHRRDPMLTYAMTALAANKVARLHDGGRGARATFGRLEVEPNGTNAIASVVRAWMDARAADEPDLDDLVTTITRQALERAERDGTTVSITQESRAAAVEFEVALRDRLANLLGDVPVLATGAGHDAGVLSQHGIPTAMVFVRNPTGISHSPLEFAERDDCLAGVDALTDVVAHLAGVP